MQSAHPLLLLPLQAGQVGCHTPHLATSYLHDTCIDTHVVCRVCVVCVVLVYPRPWCSHFYHRAKQMILQFVLVRPLCSFATVLFLVLDIYGEGSFAPNRGTTSDARTHARTRVADLSPPMTTGYLYITIINNVSITVPHAARLLRATPSAQPTDDAHTCAHLRWACAVCAGGDVLPGHVLRSSR